MKNKTCTSNKDIEEEKEKKHVCQLQEAQKIIRMHGTFER